MTIRVSILLYCLLFSFLQAQTPVTAAKKTAKTSAESQTVVPPPEVKDAFTREFPEVTPVWKMDGKNFRVEFVDPETFKGRSITYTPEGQVLRRESEIENSSYPQAINDFYIKKYPGEKFKTWSSKDEKGETVYFIQREGETVWFDSKGNHLQARK